MTGRQGATLPMPADRQGQAGCASHVPSLRGESATAAPGGSQTDGTSAGRAATAWRDSADPAAPQPAERQAPPGVPSGCAAGPRPERLLLREAGVPFRKQIPRGSGRQILVLTQHGSENVSQLVHGAFGFELQRQLSQVPESLDPSRGKPHAAGGRGPSRETRVPQGCWGPRRRGIIPHRWLLSFQNLSSQPPRLAVTQGNFSRRSESSLCIINSNALPPVLHLLQHYFRNSKGV